MNLLLVVREEAVCLCILLYMMIYSWKFIRENDFFLRLNLFGLGHVIFDIITVNTVNRLDTVPLWLNSVCHVAFYIFAILFCCELFQFVLDTVYGRRKNRQTQWPVYLVPLVYLAIIPFLRIDYLQGNGSNYSFGPTVFVGYGLAVLLFFASEAILVLHFKELESNIRHSLVPGFVLMTVAVIAQVFVPELLFTGAAVTLVTVGVFLSIANPMEKYRERAFYDTSLHIKNRNAYTDEIQKLSALPPEELLAHQFALVAFDLNGLKRINDHFGHPAGDQYLRAAADIIQMELQSAKGVYRTGGDEFMAIYMDTGLNVIRMEISNMTVSCSDRAMAYELPLSISYGYVMMEPGETVYAVERRADEEMFAFKRRRYENTEFDRRKR